MNVEGDVETAKSYYVYTTTATSIATVNATIKAKNTKGKSSRNTKGDFEI